MLAAGIRGKEKLQQLDSRLRPTVVWLFDLLEQAGVRGQLYDVYRSPEDQDRRYAAGDTSARAGSSPHQFRLAFDFVVDEGENSQFQRQLQQWWKAIGFTVLEQPVGKGVYDRSHVEAPNWRAWVNA